MNINRSCININVSELNSGEIYQCVLYITRRERTRKEDAKTKSKKQGTDPEGRPRGKGQEPEHRRKAKRRGANPRGKPQGKGQEPEHQRKATRTGTSPAGTVYHTVYHLYIIYQGIRILMDQNINISGYHVSICTMHLSLAPKSRTSKY